MSGINYVDNPGCPDCELLSLSPEDGVEGINASVPNVENEVAIASTIQPISSLRVSLFESLIQIRFILHF
jgi:hypothetical protein